MKNEEYNEDHEQCVISVMQFRGVLKTYTSRLSRFEVLVFKEKKENYCVSFFKVSMHTVHGNLHHAGSSLYFKI